jgi:hypothetical protein
MPPKTQVNSATGIMGVTGSGKSSLLATLAKYVWRRWHKVTLYYNSDGGGFPAEIQACVALGIMRVFRMYTRDPNDQGLSFETCQRACQGWWPKRIDPATGEVAPGVEMIPPVALRFEMRCPEGHVVKIVPSEALLTPTVCPQCRKPVTKADMRVSKTVARNKGFEDVGAVQYDGLSSMLAWEMRDMGHRAGRLELKGEESSIGGKVSSGDLKFGGSTRSHVGFVQARGEELVHITLGIPNLVVPPTFTMLTHEDVDERSLSIIGPKIAGRAKTDEAPQWFGNMLETAKIPALQGNGEQRILYLNEFTDPRGVRHLCKHRGSPGTMPAYLIDPPEDPARPDLAFTGFNLGLFFEMLDGALDRRIEEVKAEFPDAPGLPEGIVEVGDNSIQSAPMNTQEGTGPTAMSTGPATLSTPPATQAPVAPPAAAAPRGRKRTAAVPPPPPAQPAIPAATSPAVSAPPGAPLAPEASTPAPVAETAAAPVPAATAPAPVPTPTPAPTPPVTAPPALSGAVRPGVAPPPGRRPSAPAPSHPAAAAVAAPTTATPTPPVPGGTPAGMTVTGPAAARPTAVSPRAPAAAPRPPAARAATTTPQ